MNDEVRRAVRVQVRIDLDYSVEGTSFTAELTDLSEDGCFIDTTYPHEPGTEIEFSFRLPDGSPPISGRGRVAWHQPMLGMGIRFVYLDDEHRERLRFFVGSVYFGFGPDDGPEDGSA